MKELGWATWMEDRAESRSIHNRRPHVQQGTTARSPARSRGREAYVQRGTPVRSCGRICEMCVRRAVRVDPQSRAPPAIHLATYRHHHHYDHHRLARIPQPIRQRLSAVAATSADPHAHAARRAAPRAQSRPRQATAERQAKKQMSLCESRMMMTMTIALFPTLRLTGGTHQTREGKANARSCGLEGR